MNDKNLLETIIELLKDCNDIELLLLIKSLLASS
jgi:hypothetical protein